MLVRGCLASLVGLAGCSARPELPPLQAYDGQTRRVVVIAALGDYLLPQYRASFEASLPRALARCAVQAKVLDAQGTLAYGDPVEVASAIAVSGADTVLRIDDIDRPQEAPRPNTVTFQLTLSNVETGRPVWRRQEQVQLIGAWFGLVDLGRSFADDLVELMSRTGAIKGCAR